MFKFKHGVDNKWIAGCTILLLVFAVLGASIYYGFKSCNTLGRCLAVTAIFAGAGLLATALQERSPVSPRIILLLFFLYLIIQLVLQ